MTKQIPMMEPDVEEQKRVAENIAARLGTRGVEVSEGDSTEDLASLLEAVEAFEASVEAFGGDLMVDEPPAGKTAQPDNPAFVLPTRRARESARAFTVRVLKARGTMRKR